MAAISGSQVGTFVLLVLFGALAVAGLIVGVTFGIVFGLSSPRNSTIGHNETMTTVEPSTSSPSLTATPYPSSYGTYRYMAVTSPSNVCSQIGTDVIMRLGGSAVDAAIATMLCVGAVNVWSNGIGGGHFSTIYERPRGQSDRILKVVLARERAPAFATQDMFVNGSASSVVGGKAIGIPGEIKGFYDEWKMFGRVAWSDLFQPTIRLMENGFRVERRLANSIKNYETLMRNDSNFSELFVKPDGSLAVTGDLVVNRKLAATLRVLAADPNSFYSGALAQQIVDDIKDYGGNITLQDLQGYNTTIKDPIKVTLRNGNYTLYNPPPPSGGAVLDFIVGILDGYNFTEDDVSDVNRTTLTYHRIVEAFKFAYAKRSRLGDMDFINITELVSNLTSADFAASIRQQINDTTTREVFFYQPDFVSVENHGTAHINVLAPDGSAVAMTSTINYFFGAQVRGSRTGIVFNDQMDDFSTPGVTNVFGFPPSPNNFIVPGKIPQSSMCPTIVFDSSGEVAFLGGGVGGSRITTQVAFVMMGSLWFKRDLLTADDTGRIHHQLVPNEIVAERWLDSAIVAGLRAKGHTVNVLQPPNDYIAFVNTVRVKCPPRNAIGSDVASNMTSCIEAIVDGRHGGIPDGV